MEFATGNISFESRWYRKKSENQYKLQELQDIYLFICYYLFINYLVRFYRLNLRDDKTSNKIPHVNSPTHF